MFRGHFVATFVQKPLLTQYRWFIALFYDKYLLNVHVGVTTGIHRYEQHDKGISFSCLDAWAFLKIKNMSYDYFGEVCNSI